MLQVVVRDDKRLLLNDQGEIIVKLRRFSELQGSLGVAAFILASGPSAAHFSVADFKDYPFIAMNGSILACEKWGVRPYFYLCDDDRFSQGRTELALSGVKMASHVGLSLDVLSTLYRADKASFRGKSVFLLEHINRFVLKPRMSDRAFAWSIRKDPELISNFSLFRKTRNKIGFSCNLDKGYFVARTIPYVALQLCYQLGCPRVFLVGVDMNQKAGRFYEQGDAALPSRLDVDFEKRILPSFKLMADRVVKKGRFEVFNLSLDSRIPGDVIPKINARQLEHLLK